MNNRRITSAILAAGLALCLSTGAFAAEIPLERLSDSISVSEGYSALAKSRAVKNTLVVAQDETLYVPAGTKLTLKAGAQINGALVIEEGGALSVKGGSLDVYGKVLCFGKLTVGAKAKLRVMTDALLFAAQDSAVTIKGVIAKGEFADAVCLGRFTPPEQSEQLVNAYCPNAAAAVVCRSDPFEGRLQSSEPVADITVPAEYIAAPLPDGGSGEVLSVLYSNGSSVSFEIYEGKLFTVEGVLAAR